MGGPHLSQKGNLVKTLNRYIGVEIVKGSTISIIVLLSIYNFVTFGDELDDLGKGNYGLKQIFQYLALTSPRNFYELMPSAALIGTLFTLGSMANYREILAMRISGATLSQLVRAVLRAGLVLVITTILVGEFIAPDSERAAQLLKAVAQKKQLALQTKYGFWLRSGNTFINVRQLGPGEKLGNIGIYEFDNAHRLIQAVHAGHANFAIGKWYLRDFKRTRFNDHGITAETLTETLWDSLFDPELANILMVKPENLSITGLFKYINFLKENNQQSDEFQLAMWSRFLNPLVTLVMLLVALPFVFQWNRVMNTGQRMVIGVLIGLGFNLFDRTFSHIALVYGLNPIFAAFFPAVLFLSAAIVAIRKYC